MRAITFPEISFVDSFVKVLVGESADLPQTHEHEDVPGDDTTGVGREAFVEGQGALLHCLPDAVQDTGIFAFLDKPNPLPSS